ncbi:hypothetical protein Ddc_10190 [Ditylenchus destructor]|nr:hypothetical protein Ddc_10190 [Ditylenchus destructor]
MSKLWALAIPATLRDWLSIHQPYLCFSAFDLCLNEGHEGRIESLGHHIAEKGGLEGVFNPTSLWALHERLTIRPSAPPLTYYCPWLISRDPRSRHSVKYQIMK